MEARIDTALSQAIERMRDGEGAEASTASVLALAGPSSSAEASSDGVSAFGMMAKGAGAIAAVLTLFFAHGALERHNLDRWRGQVEQAVLSQPGVAGYPLDTRIDASGTAIVVRGVLPDAAAAEGIADRIAALPLPVEVHLRAPGRGNAYRMSVTYKIVVLGDFGVGKTSLIRRYVLDEFSDSYRATLGVHLYKHEDNVETDGGAATVNLVVWDIEGGPMPTAQTRRYIAGASGAVVVGDLTRDDPFSSMRAACDLVEAQLPGRPLGFAMNKCDLPRAASADVTHALAKQFGATVVETSAKTGDRVKDLFHVIGRGILARNL